LFSNRLKESENTLEYLDDLRFAGAPMEELSFWLYSPSNLYRKGKMAFPSDKIALVIRANETAIP